MGNKSSLTQTNFLFTIKAFLKITIGLVLAFMVSTPSIAQTSTILEQYNRLPNFGMYKDTYFITGVPINKQINNQTADAKFQISIRQRLFNKIMPSDIQFLLIYTQKSFWHVYQESSPFTDNNYNPGLLFIKPYTQNSQLKGFVSISFEHESNGKDDEDNRSWNFFTLSGNYFFNDHLSVQGKLWYGWLGDDNTDLFDYRGCGLIAFNYTIPNDRIGVSFVINPIKDFSINTQLEFSFKLSKASNQYMFLQWYNGYGDSLLDYNKHSSMVRIGISLKPTVSRLY